MYEHIIRFLYWYSDVFTKIRYQIMSIRFKQLEKKRIEYLVSKHKNLKKTFKTKENKLVYKPKPELKFHGKSLSLLTSYNKFKVIHFYS